MKKIKNFRFCCIKQNKQNALALSIFFAVLFAISFAFAYDIKEGEITLIRPNSPNIDFGYIPPEYLSIEDLVFYTCIQEPDIPVKSTMFCLDDISFKDLETNKWDSSGNCFISSYDISQKDCENIIIESEYVKNDEVVKITQPLKINRYSSILDAVLKKQYSDGGWHTAMDTVSGVWVLSNYSTIFSDEIDLAIDWLKKNRNNEYKCWPNLDCSTRETAKVLSFLTMSHINDSSRALYDGLVYLRKQQNFYLIDEKFNLSVMPYESGVTNCILSYEHSHLNNEEFNITQNETSAYELLAYPLGRLILICDQNINANLTTSDNELVFSYEGDNLSFTLPYPCWSIDEKWGDCDLLTTEYAMMTDIHQENKDAGMLYLESELKTGRIGEQYLKQENDIIETALFTYISEDEDKDDSTISWLRYKQNNNGSWSNYSTQEEQLNATSFALLGLLKSGVSRNNEVIEDAEKWVSYQEFLLTQNKTAEYIGWNSTELNALAFTVLKNNARPLIKFKPMILLMNKETNDIELYNPTAFPLEDVTYELSEEIEKHANVSDEKNEIKAYSYIKLQLARTTADTGNVFGYMTVMNAGIEIAKVPVMIVNYPKINITLKQNTLNVFGNTGKIDFNVDKTADSFSCILSWEEEGISSKSDFNMITGAFSVDVSFSTNERLEKTYHGRFKCTTTKGEKKEFNLPFLIDISRYPTVPFSIYSDSVVINTSGKQAYITVKNNLNESIEVEAKFLKNEQLFKIAQSPILIDPNKEANITIFNNVPPEANITHSNTIEISSIGQTRLISFNSFIIGKPEKKLDAWVIYSIGGLVIAIIIVGSYFLYKYRKEIESYFKKEKKVDMVRLRIKKLEEHEKNTAIINMIKIMRMLKKEDKEIRQKLVTEGFSEKEIDDAIQNEDTYDAPIGKNKTQEIDAQVFADK